MCGVPRPVNTSRQCNAHSRQADSELYTRWHCVHILFVNYHFNLLAVAMGPPGAGHP